MVSNKYLSPKCTMLGIWITEIIGLQSNQSQKSEIMKNYQLQKSVAWKEGMTQLYCEKKNERNLRYYKKAVSKTLDLENRSVSQIRGSKTDVSHTRASEETLVSQIHSSEIYDSDTCVREETVVSQIRGS